LNAEPFPLFANAAPHSLQNFALLFRVTVPQLLQFFGIDQAW
jgi:hypothetical protein